MTVIDERPTNGGGDSARVRREQTRSLTVSAFLAAVVHLLSSSLSRTVCDDSGWAHCVSVRAAPSVMVFAAIVAIFLATVRFAKSRSRSAVEVDLVLNRGKIALVILVVAVALLTWILVWTYNSHWAPYGSGVFPFAWPLNLELDVRR